MRSGRGAECTEAEKCSKKCRVSIEAGGVERTKAALSCVPISQSGSLRKILRHVFGFSFFTLFEASNDEIFENSYRVSRKKFISTYLLN